MTANQTQTDGHEAQPDEEMKEVAHVETKRLSKIESESESDYWLTITNAMKRTVLSDAELDDCSLQFIPEEYGEETGSGLGVVPALIYTGEEAQDGRGRNLWRSVQTEQLATTKRSRVRIPSEVIETLGYDADDCDGDLVDVYAGANVVMFGKPVTKTFDIPELPESIREAVNQ